MTIYNRLNFVVSNHSFPGVNHFDEAKRAVRPLARLKVSQFA